jgi:polyphosphate glucokinase
MNDAALQALGSYEGGRMLFLGLGTGIGSALVDQHTVVSLDLGQLPHAGSREVFELLGKAGLKKLGKSRWQRLVIDTALKLRLITHSDEVVLGGGQAKHLRDLPSGLRQGGNEQVIQGGVRLWNELPDPTAMDDQVWRIL